MNSGAPEGVSIPAPLVATVVLLLLHRDCRGRDRRANSNITESGAKHHNHNRTCYIYVGQAKTKSE